MKNIGRIVLTFGLLAVPAVALAQTDDPQKKSEIKVGKLDVIYEEDEFKGVEIDQGDEDETEEFLYQFLADDSLLFLKTSWSRHIIYSYIIR